MALKPFDYDMDIISKLEDEPNDVGGMEADALKAKFDEGGKAIQTYLNEQLVPNIVLGHGIEDRYGTKLDVRPVLRFINSKVKVEADAIVIDPANGSDGEDGEDGKSAYETAVEGGYTGTEAEFAKELATVGDKAASVKVTEITFFATEWSQIENGYKQTVTVEGGNENSLVALQPTPEQVFMLMDAGVTALMVNNDSGTFVAHIFGEKPTEDLTLQASLTEANDIRGGGGGNEPEVPDVPVVEKLAAPVIRLVTDDDTGGGDSGDTEGNTPAILGVAILGRTILGDTSGSLKKLSAPVIRLETVSDDTGDDGGDEPAPVKLATPTVTLYTEPVEPDEPEPDEPDVPVVEKLAAPVIELVVIKPEEPVVVKLATPEIQLVEV